MSQELSLADVGILKSAAGGCSCGGSKFTYRLPIKITEGIFSLLLQFGELNSDVATSHLIRINTPDYKISAIKRLKDIVIYHIYIVIHLYVVGKCQEKLHYYIIY
jgi:hypothetical protein